MLFGLLVKRGAHNSNILLGILPLSSVYLRREHPWWTDPSNQWPHSVTKVKLTSDLPLLDSLFINCCKGSRSTWSNRWGVSYCFSFSCNMSEAFHINFAVVKLHDINLNHFVKTMVCTLETLLLSDYLKLYLVMQ